MTEDDKQAVADEPDVQSETVTEETSAQEPKGDDLETLLAEYEKETGTSQPQQATQKQPDDDTAERLKRLEQQLNEREYQSDIGAAINAVRGDLSSDQFDDAFMDAWLNARAKEDPRVATAWLKRHENPNGFKKVLNGLGHQFAQKYGKFSDRDEEATSSREAVAAAVRGQGKPAPDGEAEPDFSQMSDTEYREYVKKKFKFSPL